MKTKLLFTTVLVAAMSGTALPVHALQGAATSVALFSAEQADGEQTATFVDVTGAYVINASCTENYGWSKDARNVSASYNVNNKVLNSEVYNGAGIEFWTSDGLQDGDLIYQDITGLPNGTYRLTAYAMGRNQNGGDACTDGLYLFANDSETAVTTNVWGEFTTTVVVAENKLKIGLRVQSGNLNNWIAIAGAKLEFSGGELAFYESALNLKVEQAKALGQEYETDKLVPTAYSAQLKAVTATTCTTVDEYKQAISQIDELVAEVNDVKTKFYNVFLYSYEYADKILTSFTADASAVTALQNAMESARESAVATDDLTTWAQYCNTVLSACKVYYDSRTSVSAGVENLDVTPLCVINAGFDDKSMEGWNCTAVPNLDNGMPLFNFDQWWQPTFDFYQDVPVLNGLYYVSVQEHATIGDKTDLFIQSTEGRMTAKMNWNHGGTADVAAVDWAVDKERNRATTGAVLVVDGNVRIGVNVHRGFNGSLFFDNFRLVMVNDGADEIKALYDSKKTEAEAIDQDILLDVFKQPLLAALAMPVETTDDYYAAYNALVKAVSDCNASMAATTALTSLIGECQSYYDNSKAVTTIKSALADAIAEAERYQELTTVEELESYVETLEHARRVFVANAVPTGDVQFDMTFMLTNPDLSDLPAWTAQAGWYTDTNKAIQCMHNGEVASADGKQAFYEIYAGSKTPMPMGNILYQKVVLAPGAYKMTAYAYGKGVNDNYTGDFSGNFFAGETKGDAVTAAILTPGSVEFVQLAESEIKLGLYSDGTGGANWAGIGYMKLYKLAADDMSLNETDATYSVSTDTYTNVVVNRTLKAEDKWNTFCVPFDMSADQLSANEITEVRKLESAETQGENVILTFSEPLQTVEAGVPYIVKASSAVSQIEADGVVVKAAAPASLAVGDVIMQGNYGSTTITGDNYFISDNVFYRAADKNVTVNGFRSYIRFNDAQAAGVNRMLINIDGEVTGIETVAGEVENAVVDVYSIDGRCLKSDVKVTEALEGLHKGIYIVGGKKVVIK